MPKQTLSSVLTVAEACEALRVSRTTFYRLLRAGKLKSIHLGRRRLVRPEELERLLQAAETL